MRDLLFKCPECVANLAFDRKLAGKTLFCPSCKERIAVPVPDTSFSCPSCNTELHVQSDTAGAFECPACGSTIAIEGESASIEPESVTEEKPKLRLQEKSTEIRERKCQYCNADILQDAVICVHCGIDLRTGRPYPSLDGLMNETLKVARISALAVCSLVLGILSLVSFFVNGILGVFCGISAIIFGHLARSRIKRSNGALGGGGLAMGGLITGYTVIILVPLLAALLLPNLGAVREKARRVNCLSNENRIWKAAATWGLDPIDAFRPPFPPDFQTLVKEGGVTPEIFICPSSGRKPGPMSQVDQWSDYIMVTNRTASDGDKVLIYEMPDCHKDDGGGGNVVYVDGRGRWLDADEYRRVTEGLKRTNWNPVSEDNSKPTPATFFWAQGFRNFCLDLVGDKKTPSQAN